MSRRFVTPRVLQQVRELIAQGCLTVEIARVTGLSQSTIFKIRQRRYDEQRLHRRFSDDMPEYERPGDSTENHDGLAEEPQQSDDPSSTQDNARKVTWCPQCRCHIFPPCQLCRARRHRQTIQQAKAKTGRSVVTPDNVDEQTRARLQLSVAQIGLPMRMTNFLQRSGIETVNDLLHCTRAELSRIPNIAGKSIAQIIQALERLGFRSKS